jgi:uncharacterized protein (DUF2237 family)
MDTDQLISHSRARFEHEAARRTLREKYQAKLTFAYRGGLWKAGPELLSVLNCCTMDKEVVLEDLYENPVKVNTKELWNLAAERWQECMNAWLTEYDQINNNR